MLSFQFCDKKWPWTDTGGYSYRNMCYIYFNSSIETLTRSNRKIDHDYNKHSIHIVNGTGGRDSLISFPPVTDVEPSGNIYDYNH